MPLLIDGIVVEIALDQDDRRSFVTAAARQIAETAEQVGQLARRGAQRQVAAAKIVGLSALMTTTVPSMEKTIARLHENGLHVPVIVGGAVLTPDYAKKIGADYYAKDAKQSADIAKSILG